MAPSLDPAGVGVKERHAPHLRIGVSGWGGGHQFPRLLPGLHRTLPPDVILTLLVPDQGAGELPEELQQLQGRECWAVPWWEGDSFLWHPQPRVASLLRQQEILAGYGFSGSIGLHWRTRDIEANAWAFFESGWERRAGKEYEAIEMYRDHVASGWGIDDRCDQVSEIAGLLQAAEAEQWFRTASPEFFGYTPQWGQIEPAKKKKIQGLLDKLIEIGQGEREPSDGFNSGGEDLRHAISTLRFVLYLDTWSRCVAGAQEAYRRGAHEEAWRLISQAPVLDALRAYMARVTTRGELGVLASINQRAWQFYRELYERIVAEVDPATAPPSGVLPELPFEAPAVVLPVRSYWQPGDSHATWRLIAGSLDVAAVFLRVNDSTGASRRFKFSQDQDRAPFVSGCKGMSSRPSRPVLPSTR